MSSQPSNGALTAQQFHAARRFVDTDFGRIAYVEAGAGPAALFVHGATLNGYQWRHQLGGLADIRRVIAPDSLGMGHTESHPDQPLGIKNQAAMLAAFVEALGIDRVDLVGNDSGGGIAQIFAATHPEKIRSLTLTNCEVNDYDENSPASVQFRQSVESGKMLAALQAAAENPAVGRKVFASVYQRAADLPDDVVQTYVRPLLQSPERIRQMLGYFAATTNKDLIAIKDKLEALRAPALILWGTADGFFPVKWAYWLKEHLPNVKEVVEIPDAPVFWPEERCAFLNDKLRAFWTLTAGGAA